MSMRTRVVVQLFEDLCKDDGPCVTHSTVCFNMTKEAAFELVVIDNLLIPPHSDIWTRVWTDVVTTFRDSGKIMDKATTKQLVNALVAKHKLGKADSGPINVPTPCRGGQGEAAGEAEPEPEQALIVDIQKLHNFSLWDTVGGLGCRSFVNGFEMFRRLCA